jgi:hypothetical protein
MLETKLNSNPSTLHPFTLHTEVHISLSPPLFETYV